MTAPSPVLEVTDATFAEAVIEESKNRPVVVDFWADWCGPCRVLSPIIEQVAAEFGEDVLLAKLDTDRNPQTAGAYRIQAHPSVKAFVDGEVANEFAGALPEEHVRAFFAELVTTPAEAATAAAEDLAASGDLAGAERATARCWRRTRTTPTPSRVSPPSSSNGTIAKGPRSSSSGPATIVAPRPSATTSSWRSSPPGTTPPRWRRKLGSNPAIPAPVTAGASCWPPTAATRSRSTSCSNPCASTATSKPTPPRKAVLAVFDILGFESTLVREYQRRLTQLLF